MADVASEPLTRSVWWAAGLAVVVGVVVDLVFFGALVAVAFINWWTTPASTTVIIDRGSARLLVFTLLPLLAVAAALVLCTLAARPHRVYGFCIGVIAALLPAWYLGPALTAWVFGSWPR